MGVSREPTAAERRRLRKAALEVRIEQQRIDLLVESSRWREASSGIDRAWHGLMRWKVPLVGLGGLVLLKRQNKDRPRSLMQLGQRVLAGAFLLQRARRLLAALR